MGPDRTLRALPLRPSRQRTPGIQTYPPGDTPPALPQPEGPAGPNLVSGYENAASLVFLPCFSPADSQNRLAVSEGRGVLEENKRILPPILSRGVALPSQIQQAGSNGVKRIHTRPLLAEKARRGRTHDRCARQVCTAAVSPRLGDSPRLHGLYNLPPPVACTWREDTVEGGPPRGKRLPLECVVKEEHRLSLDRILSSLGRIRVQSFDEHGAEQELRRDDMLRHWLVLPTGAHFPPVFWTVDNLLIESDKAFPSLPTIGQRTRGGGKPRLCIDTTIYRQQRQPCESIVPPLHIG